MISVISICGAGDGSTMSAVEFAATGLPDRSVTFDTDTVWDRPVGSPARVSTTNAGFACTTAAVTAMVFTGEDVWYTV